MDLTIAEAAIVLGRTPRAVRYMIKEGRLPAQRAGRVYLVRRADLPLSPGAQAQLETRQTTLRQMVDTILLPPVKANVHAQGSKPTPPKLEMAKPATATQAGTTLPGATLPGATGALPYISPDTPFLETGDLGTPPSLTTGPPARYTVRHLEVFHAAVSTYHALAVLTPTLPETDLAGPALLALRDGLQLLCAGLYQFDLRRRCDQLEHSRERFSCALVDLALLTTLHPDHASLIEPLLAQLEAQVLPMLRGLLRRADRQPGPGKKGRR